MTNCVYAPCDYVEKVDGRIEKVESTVSKLEISSAVMQRDIKMVLGIVSFIAVSVGVWLLNAILGIIH